MECYTSIHTFPKDFIKEVRRTKSAAEYKGECWAPFLWFDIDQKGNLPQAVEDAVKLVDCLMEYGLTEENIQIWLSGGKGFHVGFAIEAFGSSAMQPSENFPKQCGAVAETIAKHVGIRIDMALYHHVAMLRCPNSLYRPANPHSSDDFYAVDVNTISRYKIPLKYEELKRPDALTFIQELARNIRPLADLSDDEREIPEGADSVPYIPITEPVPALEELWRRVTASCMPTKAASATNWNPSYIQTPQLRKSTQNFMANGAPEGKRASELFKSAADCKRHGLPEETIKAILSPAAEQAGLEPKEIERQIQCGIKAGGQFTVQSHDPLADTDTRWRNRRNPDTFKPFPMACLPEAMRRYVEEKARSLNQNPAGLAFALLVQAGAHVGAAVKLRLKNDWFVAPILWLGVIGISGSGKSPLLAAGPGLVKDKEKELFELHRQEVKKYDMVKKAYEHELKIACKQGNFEDFRDPPTEPRRRKISVTTATIEGLHRDIEDNPRGLFLLYDELASFFGDTERNQRAGASSEWLSGYNGSFINSSRKKADETYAGEACWAVAGASTPERLEEILRKGGRVSDGTLSRFCLVWPPEAEGISHEDVSENVIAAMKNILIDLHDVDFVDGKSHYVSLDAGAGRMWKAWQEEIYRKKNNVDTDAETSFLAKSEEVLARIALILHLLENITRPDTPKSARYNGQFPSSDIPKMNRAHKIPKEISAETFQRAETIARWIINETRECYRRFGFVKPQASEEEILEIIRRNENPMTARDIGQAKGRYRSKNGRKQLEETLDKLVDAGKLAYEETPHGNGNLIRKYHLPEC